MKLITKAAAFGIASAVALSGCFEGPKDKGPIGQLALNLTTGAVTINTAHYSITNPSTTILPAPMSGDIDVTHVPGNKYGAQIGGIPQGTGFTLTMTADSVDQKTHCNGSAQFDVQAGHVTQVAMTLQCTGQVNTGSVRADATLNDCPLVTNLTVLPTAVTVGAQIHVFGAGSDQEHDPLTFAWTASGGSFANAAAADTQYNCSAPGVQTVTIRVSDGDAACPSSTLSAQVTCIAAECGNGAVNPAAGEECDPPGTATCDANCQRVAICGDGFVDGMEACDDHNTTGGDGCSATCAVEACGNGVVDTGEQCDDGNTVATDSCTTTCRPAACGDGIVQTGVEQCDDHNTANGDGCSSTCHTEAIAVCGDGMISGSESCDPPGTPVGSQQCDSTCHLAADACVSCQASSCTSFSPFGGANLVADCYMAPGNAASGPATGTAKSKLCAALFKCISDSNCADNGAPTSDCYCGAGVDPGACGTPMGACIAQVQAAAETTDVNTILERYVDPAYAVGNATRLVQCDQFLCQTQCGL